MNATHDMPESLATWNEAWGFFETALSNTSCSEDDARAIWDDINCEQTLYFLDSRDSCRLTDAMTHYDWISGPRPPGHDVQSLNSSTPATETHMPYPRRRRSR